MGGFSDYDYSQEQVQFHSATDRLMAGIKLYKTGRAKKLMIVSGSGKIMNPEEREALFVKDYLLSIGIPEKDLMIESESKNTYENAVNSTKILNEKYPKGKFILITSATHMPRAKRCFNKVGLTVTPFSVDHKAGPRKYIIDHLLLPDIESFKKAEKYYLLAVKNGNIIDMNEQTHGWLENDRFIIDLTSYQFNERLGESFDKIIPYELIQKCSSDFINKNIESFLKFRFSLFRYGKLNEDFVKKYAEPNDYYQIGFNENFTWSFEFVINHLDYLESIYSISQNQSLYNTLFSNFKEKEFDALLSSY